MNNVNEIKEAIARLPEDELASLRHWFEEFDTEKWDKQFEDDVQSGKLDRVAYQSSYQTIGDLYLLTKF